MQINCCFDSKFWTYGGFFLYLVGKMKDSFKKRSSMKLMGISIIYSHSSSSEQERDLQRSFANLKIKLLFDSQNPKKPVKFVTVMNV